jgi:cell shape-determining protein MreC
MMNYHRDNYILPQTTRRVLISVVIIGCAVGLYFLTPQLRIVAAQVWQTGDTWHQVLAQLTTSKSDQAHAITILEERVAFLENENTMLREMSPNVSLVSDRPGIVAYITKLPTGSLYNAYIIDRGSNDGIAVGDTAFAFGGVALGRVTDVTDTTAIVKALFAPDMTTTGIHDFSQTRIEVTGRGSGVFRAEAPRDFTITEGDLIRWGEVREATVLGYVEQVRFDDRDPVQEVFIRMPFSLHELQFVTIQ